MVVNNGEWTWIDVFFLNFGKMAEFYISAFKPRKPLGHLMICKQIRKLENPMELQTNVIHCKVVNPRTSKTAVLEFIQIVLGVQHTWLFYGKSWRLKWCILGTGSAPHLPSRSAPKDTCHKHNNNQTHPRHHHDHHNHQRRWSSSSSSSSSSWSSSSPS